MSDVKKRNPYGRGFGRRQYRSWQRKSTDEILVKITSHIPKHYYDKLVTQRSIRKMNVARLIAYSIINELQTDTPFNFQLRPTIPYKKDAFLHEAGKILNFLRERERSIGLDVLIMCHAEMGLTYDEAVNGYEELRQGGYVMEEPPISTQVEYPPDYVFVRLAKGLSKIPKKEKPRKNAAVKPLGGGSGPLNEV